MNALLSIRCLSQRCSLYFGARAMASALIPTPLLPRLIVAAIVLLATASEGIAQSGVRTWTDASGRFTVRASVDRSDDETVWLKKEDGQVIAVKIKVLSPSDQTVVANARGKSAGTDSRTPARPAVKVIMNESCAWDVAETSLAEFLANEIPAAVILDARAFHDLRITPQTTITSSFRGPLADGLDSVLTPLELSWSEADGVIRVTSFAALQRSPTIVAYRLRNGMPSSQRAIEAIQYIQPESWETSGGPGVVIVSGNFLFVRQSAAVHRQISKESGALLTAVTPPAKPSKLLPPKIQEATTSVRFDNVPLATALERLSESTGIAIAIGEGSTEPEAMPANRRVTLGVTDAKLTTVLDQICSALEVTWRVEKDQVRLLTYAAINNDPSNYLWKLSAGDRRNAMPLIHLIQSLVEPASWRDSGGRGIIRLDAAAGQLVITNRFATLLQVEKLLRDRESLQTSR